MERCLSSNCCRLARAGAVQGQFRSGVLGASSGLSGLEVGPSGLEMPSRCRFQQREFSANQPTWTSGSLHSCFHSLETSLFAPE